MFSYFVLWLCNFLIPFINYIQFCSTSLFWRYIKASEGKSICTMFLTEITWMFLTDKINWTVGFIHNWKLGKLPNLLWCRALKWRDFEEIFKYPPVWVALNRSTSLCRPKPPHPLQLCHRFNPKWDFEWTNISSSRNTKMIDTLRTSNLTSVLFILVCLKLPWNHRVIWKYTL